MNLQSSDPVHLVTENDFNNPDNSDITVVGWYFWDETSANRNGPYETRELCNTAFLEYCRWLNEGPSFKQTIKETSL